MTVASARNAPLASSASTHRSRSSPPITATVLRISSSVAGSIVTSRIASRSRSMVRVVCVTPMGLSADL